MTRRSRYATVLLIFGGLLIPSVPAAKERICGGNEYTIINATGGFLRCLLCAKCNPGYGLEPSCGSTLHHPPSIIDCPPCKAGTFSSEFDSSPCHVCHQCAQHELTETLCSKTSDTKCSGTCENGYYQATKAPLNCQKCSACCSDGKDEKINDCANQGLDDQCSPRPDKNCGSSGSKGGGLSTAAISVIGVIGAVAIAILIAATSYFCYRRRKLNEQQNTEVALSTEVPAVTVDNPGEQNQTSSPDSHINEDSHISSTDNEVKFLGPSNGQNPTYERTPCGSEHDLSGSVRHNQNHPQGGSPQNAPAVSDLGAGQDQSLHERESKPPLRRRDSQDSQGSGDGEAKFRKRSGSAIGLEKLKRKMSEKGDSLLEEEPDDNHGPIIINKHPKSQTAKEGSKVELKCKVHGKSTNLLYQWFKDGEALLTKNASSLVLDPVELRDFGHYMCYVSYQDSFGDGVKSSLAKLNVTPQCQNGMRPKRLADLDFSTTEKVGVLLQNKKFGLGGWREVAVKYELEGYKIEQLSNSKEPGKHIMEFLQGSKPNLTVYDFCKVLKEDNIRRLDIVKLLEDHFLVREGNAYV